MQKLGWVVLAFTLAGCPAVVIPERNDAGRCGPSTCGGCCDGEGVCQLGTGPTQCGKAGAACGACVDMGECALPVELAFFSVAKGDTVVRQLELKNPSDTRWTATIGAVSSNNSDGTSFVSDVPPGELKVSGGESKLIRFSFKPDEVRSYLATITIRKSAQCSPQIVKLTGTGVDAVLTWAPNPLDFGYLPPGTARMRTFTFTNISDRIVGVTNIVPSSSEFTVVTPALDVPAMGEATVQVVARPNLLGPREARLDFKTTLVKQPAGIQQVQVYGGGPDIDAPAVLDFGPVAYFAGSNAAVNRTLTVNNLGTRPPNGDPKANLHLGVDGTGTNFWSISVAADVANNTATLTELDVFTPSYDPAIGLEAGKPGLVVPVRITPASPGAKEWIVTIHSNDVDEPAFEVRIRATANVLPPCTWEVQPAPGVDFGQVAPGESRDRVVSFVNKGQNAGDICALSGVSIGSSAFTLVGGPVASKTLQPGEIFSVRVRYAPSAPGAHTGTLTGSISNPTMPAIVIPLAGSSGQACLVFSPAQATFGTVKLTCSGPARTFLAFNMCPAPVTVVSSQVNGAYEANLAALSATTVLPPGGAGTAISVKLRPTKVGPAEGSVDVVVTQSALNVKYVLPLTGAGDMQGQNFEVLKPLGNVGHDADVLVIVDNSGSMADKQQRFANGFDAFTSYAKATGVGYHLAVTTTDMSFEAGRFVGMAGQKIITPLTPNAAALFSARVKVGINGSATEESLAPALAALTAPLSTSDNAGFLRSGASLGIVSISDADDQSPMPVSAYVNQLSTLKDPGLISFSAMAPIGATAPAGCTYDTAGGAVRTTAAVAAMRGVVHDICSPDWTLPLAEIGTIAFGGAVSSNAYPLGAIPDLTGGKLIAIHVDGVNMPEVQLGGTTRYWTYDPTTNRIVFEKLYAPEPGKTVTATYFAPCLP